MFPIFWGQNLKFLICVDKLSQIESLFSISSSRYTSFRLIQKLERGKAGNVGLKVESPSYRQQLAGFIINFFKKSDKRHPKFTTSSKTTYDGCHQCLVTLMLGTHPVSCIPSAPGGLQVHGWMEKNLLWHNFTWLSLYHPDSSGTTS